MSLWAAQPATNAANRAQHSRTFHWLTHLGLPGLICVSFIDSSPFPLPIPGTTDLLLLWLTSHHGNPWLLPACAITGSVLGGCTSWHIGRKGGEAALHRRVPPRLLDPVCRWARGNPFLAVFLPALLPPPVPLSPFLLASGALGIPLRRFVISFAAARTLRYSIVAWFGVTYGRQMIRLWSRTLDKWSTPILIAFAAMLLGGIILAVIKARRQARAIGADRPMRESAAD